MNRRSFLTGLATTLLAGTAAIRAAASMRGIIEYSGARLPQAEVMYGEVYGRSPAMDALDTLRGIERWVRDGNQLIDAPHNVTDYIPIGPTRSPGQCDTHQLSH